jgi:hypothetical protein
VVTALRGDRGSLGAPGFWSNNGWVGGETRWQVTRVSMPPAFSDSAPWRGRRHRRIPQSERLVAAPLIGDAASSSGIQFFVFVPGRPKAATDFVFCAARRTVWNGPWHRVATWHGEPRKVEARAPGARGPPRRPHGEPRRSSGPVPACASAQARAQARATAHRAR